MKLIVYTDGSTANEGSGKRFSFIGVSVQTEDGAEVASISEYIGCFNSNMTEYMAALAGVEEALRLGAQAIELRSDSLNFVNVINGLQRHRYNDKAGYEATIDKIRFHAVKLMSFKVIHVERGLNKRANYLSHHAWTKADPAIQEEMRSISKQTSAIVSIDFVEPLTMVEAEKRRLEATAKVSFLQQRISAGRKDAFVNRDRAEYGKWRDKIKQSLKKEVTQLRNLNRWIRFQHAGVNEIHSDPAAALPPFAIGDAGALVRAANVLLRRLAREGHVHFTDEEQVLVDALRDHDLHYGPKVSKVS